MAGNLYSADGGLSLTAMPGGASFERKFHAKFGERVQLYAPYAHDAMTAVYRAILHAQSASASKMVDSMRNVDFDGVTGHVAFDDAGDLRTPAGTISTFKVSQKITLVEISR